VAWPRIDGWIGDGDFWVRRSALLAEEEFFIRKAIGWVLREISTRDPAWTADWTARHVREISGVTFREAIRRLPAADAARLRALRDNPG
jgi:3-methyladenine DNA glycosylase AlkD